MYYTIVLSGMQYCARIFFVMNMLDYLDVYGDRSFKEEPFSDVDNLLISQVVYVDFDSVITEGKKIRPKEAYEQLEHRYSDLDSDFYRNVESLSHEVLKRMAFSRRYEECTIHHYVSRLNKETSEQFAALMMDLPDGTTAVSFRGTDDTLIGWKEDLMLSYTDIQSQLDAVDYVNRNCSLFRKYRFIGHSKGGNLAIYAAVHCGFLFRRNIIQVISNDGPGLRPDSYKRNRFQKIAERYRLIVPEKDGVGTIYEIAPSKTVVSTSTGNIIQSHNMATWDIDGNRLVPANRARYETDHNRKSILQFLNETNAKQREVFVRELFECFDDAKIRTVSQMSSGGLPLFLRVMKEMSEMDSEAKEIAVKMFKSYSSNFNRDFSSQIIKKKEDIRLKASAAGASISEIVNERNPFHKKKKRIPAADEKKEEL